MYNFLDNKKRLKIEFGQRVKKSRENLNLSRKDFAEITDISEYFLVQVELGKRGVSNVTLCKMAEVLCTTTDYLLTGRRDVSDTSAITCLLEKIESPFLIGAEKLLIGYINSINYIKAKVEEQAKDEDYQA